MVASLDSDDNTSNSDNDDGIISGISGIDGARDPNISLTLTDMISQSTFHSARYLLHHKFLNDVVNSYGVKIFE